MNAFRLVTLRQRGTTLLVGGLLLQRAHLAGTEPVKPEVAFMKFIGEMVV